MILLAPHVGVGGYVTAEASPVGTFNGPGTALIQSCKLKKLAKSPFAGEMQIYNFKARIDLIS